MYILEEDINEQTILKGAVVALHIIDYRYFLIVIYFRIIGLGWDDCVSNAALNNNYNK